MPRGIKRNEDMKTLQQAIDNITETWKPSLTSAALIKLFERTMWLGKYSLDMLSRVPCDEVIILAQTIRKRDKNGAYIPGDS